MQIKESPFLPQSVQGLTYHQQSSLRYPQTTHSQPPHHALCRHMAAPPSPQRCVFRNPAATEMWAGGEKTAPGREQTLRKGLRSSQSHETSHQQHSPAHRPQSITKPSPALRPPPAIPQNVLKTHSKHFFTSKPCITQAHSSLPKSRWV